RRRHTSFSRDWSSDVCSSDLVDPAARRVAVVGARRACPMGQELAHELACGLARAGVTVVSGLARGIDRAAHEGALAGGGPTVARSEERRGGKEGRIRASAGTA